MLNVSDLLEQIKQSPYREIEVKAPHTGEIAFAGIKPGDKVHGPQGTWKEKPGTLLATLTRERNPKPICAPEKGIVGAVHSELEKQFVECSTTLVTLRHHLTREEVENIILRKALYHSREGQDPDAFVRILLRSSFFRILFYRICACSARGIHDAGPENMTSPARHLSVPSVFCLSPRFTARRSLPGRRRRSPCARTRHACLSCTSPPP